MKRLLALLALLLPLSLLLAGCGEKGKSVEAVKGGPSQEEMAKVQAKVQMEMMQKMGPMGSKK